MTTLPFWSEENEHPNEHPALGQLVAPGCTGVADAGSPVPAVFWLDIDRHNWMSENRYIDEIL